MISNPNRPGRTGALALSVGLLAAACAMSRPASAAQPATELPAPRCAGTEAPFQNPDFLVGEWQRRWSGLRFHIDCSGERRDGNGYIVEGRMRPLAGGESLPFRGVWTPLSDGAIRQELLRFDVATGAWDAFFVTISRRLLR